MYLVPPTSRSYSKYLACCCWHLFWLIGLMRGGVCFLVLLRFTRTRSSLSALLSSSPTSFCSSLLSPLLFARRMGLCVSCGSKGPAALEG
ncbi:hypothetical protein QBC35DRAFT_158995 [Podospora australis]|uniref:Uncharacterized protein n=1 Tax=Podospora australis TaxID=1536484 RepID=A0AAN6X4T3_9PEZI|nr:hypothetical protein QBC35DRAFT_158995 [Podospora australis]